MQNRILYIFAALFLISPLLKGADDPKYPVSEIPADLRENAMAVIRNSVEIFEVKSEGKGRYSKSYAITVLNENGVDEAMWIQNYSQKLHRVNSIRGAIYDANGKKIENLTFDKVIDQSMIAGYSLYEDSRVKYFVPKTMSYPFTAEYSFDVEYDGLFNIPDWTPISDYNISVQKSTYQVICPAGRQIRFLANQFAGQPVININEKGVTSYIWEISNIPVKEYEPFSGPFSYFTPLVQICPNRFEIEGYSGDFNTWDDFGKRVNSVNAGRDVLPETTVSAVKELVKDCKSDFEKARKIYEFMQAKTRYLNVTVGIGSWQPIPAENVDRLGYGDCKALSNYTIALLKAAGVKACYTIIRAGENVPEPVDEFPDNSFNHAIVCLPLADDTLWLECTNQHIPFGYLGTFTDNRRALVIDENGAKLIRTKSYSGADNQLIRRSSLLLQSDGNAILKTTATHNGVLYDNKLKYFVAGSEDRKRMIHDELNIPGCMLVNIGYQEKHDIIPYIREDIEVDIPRYATISGPRLIVTLLPTGRLRDVPKKVIDRKSDVIIKRDAVATDSITIELPQGFRAEALPAEVKNETIFGSYSLKAQLISDNKLLCVRRLALNRGIHPAAKYAELVEFYKKVALSDNMKISLISQ